MKGLRHVLSLPLRKPPPVGTTPADVVLGENKWRLLHYRTSGAPDPGAATRRHATPVLLVPSLINRHYVLDLLPGKSFAEWMVAQGHDVYCIDWGTPGDEDRFVTFDTVVDRYLGRALRHVAGASPSGRAHVLGYCLGGTLAVIHAALHPDRFASLVLLAAPVAFSDDGLLSRWTRTRSFDLDALVEATGNVPWQLMQGAFHLLRPTLSLSKAVHLLDRAWDDASLDGFLALETWGNDNVSFPGECYRKYIRELYREDALVRGALSISGRRVDLRDVRCPLLAVTFEHDGIVPRESAAPVSELVSSPVREELRLPGGHVGAVVSKSASRSLWPRISAFWGAHDAATGRGAPAPHGVGASEEPAKAPARRRISGGRAARSARRRPSARPKR